MEKQCVVHEKILNLELENLNSTWGLLLTSWSSHALVIQQGRANFAF